MTIEIPNEIMKLIYEDCEAAYPEEGVGFLLGSGDELRRVRAIIRLPSAREDTARHNRYLVTPDEMLDAEKEAEKKQLDIVGVFHSHPDLSNRPSPYDLDWAIPWFSYVITSVHDGQALESRCWRLKEDRKSFIEEDLKIQ